MWGVKNSSDFGGLDFHKNENIHSIKTRKKMSDSEERQEKTG